MTVMSDTDLKYRPSIKKISHSAYKRYHTCPKMYDFHYHDKIRPTGKSSALMFGSAMDTGLNALLEGKGDGHKAFKEAFEWDDMQDVTWDGKDFDHEIFTSSQLNKIEDREYEFKCWASMRIKGRMMIDAYKEKVMPLLSEVHSVQKPTNGRPGFLDFIATITDQGKVLIDNKTSKYPYRDDAVVSDTQLPLYASSEGLTRAGFIVMVKEIKKNRIKICTKCGYDGSHRQFKTCENTKSGIRCHGTWDENVSPEVILQIIIDDIPQHNKDLITDSITETEKLIATGIFPRNLNACGKIYGKICPYYKYCWHKDKEGLDTEPKV